LWIILNARKIMDFIIFQIEIKNYINTETLRLDMNKCIKDEISERFYLRNCKKI